ncbi:MAG: hypothetical protein E1N59_2520 [Puniceicoccaceae bacterium 5H]|nr:MAG: hypothetical protein E1N59_2520 [Puniceicoccaceae bacterium 5H]
MYANGAAKSAGETRLRWALPVAFLAVLLWAYWPALALDYGHYDDYWLIVLGHQSPVSWLNNMFSAHGRPLYGMMVKALFLLVDGVPDLKWVRGIGLAGLWLMTLTLYRVLRYHSGHVGFAATIALLAGLTPSTVIYVGWAVCAPFSVGGMLAIAAAHLYWTAPGWRSWRGRVAAVCFLAAVCVYQPVAFYAPALLFVFAVVEQKPRLAWRRLVLGLALVCALCGLYFVSYEVLGHWLLSGPNTLERAKVDHDLMGIARYVLEMLYPRAFNLWGALEPGFAGLWVAGTVLLGLVALLWLRVVRRLAAWQVGLALVGFLATLTLIWVPNAIAADKSSAFRTLNAAYVLTLGVTGWGAMAALSGLHRRAHLPSWAAGLVALLVVGLFAQQTRYHLGVGYAGINHREYIAVKQGIAEAFAERPKVIPYISPLTYLDDTDYYPVELEEFGLLTSQLASYQTHILTAAVWDTFGVPSGEHAPSVTVKTYWWFDPVAYREAHLVNGFELIHDYDPRQSPEEQSQPLRTIEHPYLGSLEVYPDHWYVSPWLGKFQMVEFPKIRHTLYGPLSFYPDVDKYWAHSPQYGTIWFSRDSFPHYFDSESEQWKAMTPLAFPEAHRPGEGE